jgi:hypothetical protein
MRLVARSAVFAPLAPLAIVAACSWLTMGCAPEAILSTDRLPVRRVIVYRNGVAYFERAGKVDGDVVRFKMKQAEVGDFLATLAVMEKGGSSVRAAAFPLETDQEAGDPPPSDDKSVEKSPQEKADADDKKKGLRTVILSLDGKEHDLSVGYVAASPVWRPSYRLVVHEGGNADLQAWGIVQNLSGEDWKDVHLSLIAGAPVAFETQLGTPVIPTRPMVTDSGEVVASVPHAETSLNQQPMPVVAAPAAAAAPAPPADLDHDGIPDVSDKDEDQKELSGAQHAVGGPRARRSPAKNTAPGYGSGKGALKKAEAGGGGAPSGSATRMVDAPFAPPPPPAPVVPSGPRNLRSLAAVAVEGGSTRYDLPNTVTVPDKSATMVMLLSRAVPGEALFEFAPDGGVSDSASHPFRVARFNNKTGGVLERGPIAVFEDGSFLGQGMVDPLPAGATATVPFALERSIAIDEERKYDELGERVAKIENGQLTVERDSVKQTKYRVRNGGEKVVKVLVKHPRQNGTRLFTPPADTEDNVGTGSALVPAKVLPHTTLELVVDEREPVKRQVDWFSTLAESAMKHLLSDPKADSALVAKLNAAWKIRAEIVEKLDALSKVTAARTGLFESVEETRRNLNAIEKNHMADALRATLTQRLTETSLKIDVLMKQKVELDSKLAELRIRFKEGLRDVVYAAPPTTPQP